MPCIQGASHIPTRHLGGRTGAAGSGSERSVTGRLGRTFFGPLGQHVRGGSSEQQPVDRERARRPILRLSAHNCWRSGETGRGQRAGLWHPA